jgi:hypothetical protein
MKRKFYEGEIEMDDKYYVTIELNSKEAADWLKSQIESANPLIKGNIHIIEDKTESLDKIIERIK